ncbi:MAG: prepilin-type N-terminal cleavage/methylation domain-containing protein [candidate division WOR-3 bacterium]
MGKFRKPKMFKLTKGMTLIELMVSLVILMIVLGAIYSVLTMQQTKAINVQTTSILQTDAQAALTILRWDLFMAGYGMGQNDQVFFPQNYSNTRDSLGMRSMAFSFEASRANWAPVLEVALNSDRIKVYRHEETISNFSIGDRIGIVSNKKSLLDTGLVIQDIDTISYGAGAETIPALELHLNRITNAGQGAICIVYDYNSLVNGISYYVNNQRQLMRGNEVFLENVEDIQFRYGVDVNDNGIIDSMTNYIEWHNDLSNFSQNDLMRHLFIIRTTFVVLSERGLTDYRYPDNTITIEDHTYPLNDIQRRFKRVIVQTIAWPRNYRS